jgi:hypothetical protein
MLGHPTEDLASLEETRAFLEDVDLDVAQVTKFTPYPGTPAYPTIRQHGTFTEDWDRMNAMNFIFIPHGLTEEILEEYFDRCYRAFYSRPRVLWGLARAFAAQPSYIPRFISYARAYLAGDRTRRSERRAAPTRVTPGATDTTDTTPLAVAPIGTLPQPDLQAPAAP